VRGTPADDGDPTLTIPFAHDDGFDDGFDDGIDDGFRDRFDDGDGDMADGKWAGLDAIMAALDADLVEDLAATIDVEQRLARLSWIS
jgi:hypothetical protein